jgi:hypothetical protein
MVNRSRGHLGLTLETFTGSSGQTEINLPRIDVNERTKEALFNLLRSCDNLGLMGNPIGVRTQSCRFIRDRCTFVPRDIKVSPCMGLLHQHQTYLRTRAKITWHFVEAPGVILTLFLADPA